MIRSENWQDSYRRNVALLEGVLPADVEVVRCHNHVPLPVTTRALDTIVVELSFMENDAPVTVYAWDDPPFFCVRKQHSLQTPAAALRVVNNPG